MISVKGLNHYIGSKLLLDKVNLDIKPGCITALVGENGVGKSTLLKAIINACESVFLDDRPKSSYGVKALAKRRCVLSQELFLDFSFTALEVVLMGRMPYYKGFETKEDIAICEYWLEQMDALKLKDNLYPRLSGGEKRRVQLARVLAQIHNDESAAKYIFLDEPTTSLDLYHQFLLLDLLKSLSQNNIGIFVILHDLNLCFQYADEVAILHDKHIKYSGKTKTILNLPTVEEVFKVKASFDQQHQALIILGAKHD